jgi:endoglucanase
MNKLFTIIAVTLTASLLLFGCSSGAGNAAATGATEKTEEKGAMKNAAGKAASLSLNDNIHINQVGYREKDRKQVIVNGKAETFAVFEKSGGKPVFTGKLKGGGTDGASGDVVYYGDFSDCRTPGAYYIQVPGVGLSGVFTIGDAVYGDLKRALLKAFYYQRCGMELEEKFAGAWAHPACHTAKAAVYGREDVELDGNGGWHDAGDYGKYTVAAATALADLMMAWELFPDRFAEDVDIPESGNKTPDILDEVRYELEWLLKMQDAETGGAYHKLSTKTFPPLSMMPQDDLGKLYFSPISSAATGDFAAVTAMAARIFRPYDAAFAESCRKAAVKAWNWLEENPDPVIFKNPGDIATGEYGDANDSDERFWAAAELYRGTGNPVYGEYVKSVYRSAGTGGFGFGWQNVEGFAGIAYMNTDKAKQDETVYGFLKKALLSTADKKLAASRKDGYRITLRNGDYVWGSNMILMNDARLLILAHMLEPQKGYAEAAVGNLNYLLGGNPLNQCYVTGFGTKPVMDPHHRPSKADNAEQPVPGLVAGGPNAGLQDDIARINLKEKAPARCYIDSSGSYSTNEIAIYWNSPAVFVTAYFCGKD